VDPAGNRFVRDLDVVIDMFTRTFASPRPIDAS
jgi:hypothetical protein